MFVFMLSVYHGDSRGPARALARVRTSAKPCDRRESKIRARTPCREARTQRECNRGDTRKWDPVERVETEVRIGATEEK
jgi:hypothetical protein